ncbi:MAG: phosphatase PAP2 family protein [Flexilinea sp.]|nr:phosphatase PAP2 family protein [Flexilinea sp.]
MDDRSSFLKKLNDADEKISGKIRIRDQKSLKFRIAAVLAHSGDSWLWCGPLFILWLFASGERERTIAYWGGSIAFTALFIFVLKRLIARTRPEGDWGSVYRRTDPYSFPSGHAVRAGVILMLAFHTFHDPLLLGLFCIWAVLMILSRVATGVHYLLDICAGFLFGLLIGRIWVLLQPWFYGTFPILFDKSSWFK